MEVYHKQQKITRFRLDQTLLHRILVRKRVRARTRKLPNAPLRRQQDEPRLEGKFQFSVSASNDTAAQKQ